MEFQREVVCEVEENCYITSENTARIDGKLQFKLDKYNTVSLRDFFLQYLFNQEFDLSSV